MYVDKVTCGDNYMLIHALQHDQESPTQSPYIDVALHNCLMICVAYFFNTITLLLV